MNLKWIVAVGILEAVMVSQSAFAQMAQQSASPLPEQPKQPLVGAGGSKQSSHAVTQIKIGDGGTGGWLFLPSDPAPEKAPVVIFCHGWSAILPKGYQAWIDHLVTRGNIVLWPNYQDNLRTQPQQFLPNAIAAVKSGLQILESGNNYVRPDLDRVAVVGHSAGGMVAAGIAARAKAEGLPKMKAVMPVEPGDSRRGWASVPLADMSTMPDDTLLLILVGEEDSTVGTYDGERILHESVAVAPTSKALLMMHSDDHGAPALVANHYSPSAMLNSDGSFATEAFRPGTNRNTADIGVVDALDYLGTWRLLDQLLEAAFCVTSNRNFFDDSKLPGMGNWSDGVPVKPLSQLK